MHRRAVFVGAQHDAAKFFRVVQRAFDRQGGRQLLQRRARAAAETACRDLHVLRPHGSVDVIDGQPETDQLLWVDPDAHGSFCGKELQPADAVYPADLIVEVTRRIVGQRDCVLVG